MTSTMTSPRRNGVDVMNRQPGLIQHSADEVGQYLDMGPRCDLGDDPAVGLMRLGLTDDRLRQDAPVARDQRRRAVVARGFEAQNDFWFQSHFVCGPLPECAPVR